MRTLIFFLFLVVIFSGCASSSGVEIDTSKISGIKKGITTKEEIIKMFGTPQMTNIMSDSTYVITYQFTKAQGGAFTGTKIDMQFLQIIILKETDIVKDYLYSEHKM